MEKIDRLGWAAGLSAYCYGNHIGIRTNKPEVLEKVQGHLPPGWEYGCSPFVDYLCSLKVGGARAGSGVREYTLLYGGLTRLARTMVLEEALLALEDHLRLYVAEHARNRVFIHAGVVGWQGRAIVLPGRSFAGKTTMVAELLHAGATYYSDEYAVLDGRGYVHPYARPLALRDADGHHLRRQPAEEMGAASGTEPLPVGLVAVTQYLPGARWAPRALSPGKAVMELLNNAIPAQNQPDMVLSTLEQVVPRAAVVKGPRGEASAAARAILTELDRDSSAQRN